MRPSPANACAPIRQRAFLRFTLLFLSVFLGFSAVSIAQIKGQVTDAAGQPLANVTVQVKGSKKTAVTDAQGYYSIAADANAALIFSFVGYTTREESLKGSSTLNILMQQGDNELGQVIVTALGVKKQARAVGYSTTTIDGSKFTQSRETNIGNALTGQVAGVSVAGVATGPYGSSRVTIRGNSSLTGNNQPLYIVDNVPYDNSNQGNAGQYGGIDQGDGLTNLNPDDIENITVLKGVAATALYGYRGGNGAIIITTKSGSKSHGIGVEVNDNFTLSRVIDERDYQYVYGQGSLGVKPTDIVTANATTESAWGAKIDGTTAMNPFGNTYAYNAVKDNYKNFYKTGLNNQSSIALTGSNDKGHFRLGISDLHLSTNIPNSNMQQQALNFNTTYNITPKLQMSLTANYVFENVKNRASFSDAPGNLIASLQFVPNTYDIRWLKPRVDSNRNELLPGNQDIYFENPYFIAYEDLNQSSRNRLTGGLTLKYNLLDWLYVQAQVTRDGYIYDFKQITPNGVAYSSNNGGYMTVTEKNQHELDGNLQIGVNKKFNRDLVFNASAGMYSQDNVSTTYSGAGGPFVIPYFYSISNVAGPNKPFNYSYSHSRVNSLYGTADIGFRNYLFLSVTGRNDWFSVLNPKTNNFFYPSVSGSFVFSDAFRMPSWISFGKLRASFGGSSNTGAANPYQTVLTYGLQGYNTNGQPVGYVNSANPNNLSTIPNQFLKPVSIREAEIGVNMEFLGGRLGADLAVYNKNTTNDIVTVSVSDASGYVNNTVNIGRVRNKGIEVLLTGIPVKSRDFLWNVSWNFAYNNNKVLDLGGATNLTMDYPRNGNAVIQQIVGLTYDQIVGTKYQRNTSGQIMYDTAGLPLGTPELQPMGSGTYNKTGGITNDFHYKNFSFSFLIDYKFGAKVYSGTNLILYLDGLQKGTLVGRESYYVGPGVQEDGKTPNTKGVITQNYFGAVAAGTNNIDELFVYDASFIKLRSMSVGYNLPKSILKNGFLKAVNISLVARNVAILLKHTPNIDPESNYDNTNAQGLELSGYPGVRSFGCNVNVKF